MSGDTKFVAQNQYTDQELLDLYREALASISQKQSYQMNVGGGTRMLTLANLEEVRSQIEWLELRIDKAAPGLAVNYARLGRFRR